MNLPRTSNRTRRRWPWLFAALLPVAVFAASLKPLTFAIDPTSDSIRWTPDNRSFILSGPAMRIWDVTAFPHQSRVLCQNCGFQFGDDTIFSPNGKRIAWELSPDNHSADYHCMVVGLAKTEVFKVEGKNPLFADDEHLVTVNEEDGNLKIHNYQIGQAKPLWTTVIKPPDHAAFAVFHESFLLQDGNGYPEYWDGWVWAITPDGSRVAVKTWCLNVEPSVLIFETKTGKILRQIPATGADKLEFARDSRHLVVKGSMRVNGSEKEGAPHYKQVWDAYTGQLEGRFHYSGFQPPSHLWPDNPMSEVAKWTGNNGNQYKISHLLDFSFSPDKKWLFTQKLNNFSLWNIQHGKRICSSRKVVGLAWESFSPDNKLLAVTCNRTLYLYRLK